MKKTREASLKFLREKGASCIVGTPKAMLRHMQFSEVEWAFRITKEELEIRPIWHHGERRSPRQDPTRWPRHNAGQRAARLAEPVGR